MTPLILQIEGADNCFREGEIELLHARQRG
jgi:hypothetical protein